MSFWILNSSYILDMVVKLKAYAKYPATIFNSIFKLIFTFIIPLAFIAYYPSINILKTDDKLACLCAINNKGKDYLIKNNITSLTKYLKQYMLKYSEIIPQKWKYIDEIPLTSAGKINKKFIEHIFNVKISLPVILDREISQNSVTYKILFYAQCNFFMGHFPTFKLVLGVLQLYLAKEFANNYFNLNLGAGQWKRIKFSNIIEPDSIVNLKLEKTEKTVSYEYFSDDKKYSSGVFLCENIFDKALQLKD